MQNEILRPVLDTDEVAVPRYDIVDSTGQVLQQNVELRLKNEVMQEGTPYDEESVLPRTLAQQLGLPTSATPADAFAAVLAKSGAKVSMNAPTAADNVAAGYSIGATWIRLSYTLHNLIYSKLVEDFTAFACLVAKDGQKVTATGNGDDKVISVALEYGSETGWLYCVVTPDVTAVSAKVIAGTEEIALTVGEANVVKHKYSGTGVTFEATYATANEASTGTIVIDSLTVIDEASTLEQVENGYRDVTSETIFGHIGIGGFSDFLVDSAHWNHVFDGAWRKWVEGRPPDSLRYIEMIMTSGEWVVPNDIIGSEVMAVAVGAGGGGYYAGGCGGFVKLAFLEVKPGETFTCIVGAPGDAVSGTSTFGNPTRGEILNAPGGTGNGGEGGSGGGGGGYGGETPPGIGRQFGGGGAKENGADGGLYGGGGGSARGVGGKGGIYGGSGYGTEGAAQDGTSLLSGFINLFSPFSFPELYGSAHWPTTGPHGGGGCGGHGGFGNGTGGGGGGGLGAHGGKGCGGSDWTYHNGGGGGGGCGGHGGDAAIYGGGGGGGFFANGGNAGEDGQSPGAGGGGSYSTNPKGQGGRGAVILFYHRRNVDVLPNL